MARLELTARREKAARRAPADCHPIGVWDLARKGPVATKRRIRESKGPHAHVTANLSQLDSGEEGAQVEA